MKKSSKNINRKEFFKKISLVFLIPFAYLWKRTVDDSETILGRTIISLPGDLSNGVSFMGKIIVVKNENRMEILSSKCTHLGCTINKVENDQFVCPCHGSKYSLDGNVIEGPAAEPLRKLNVKFDNKTGERFVEV